MLFALLIVLLYLLVSIGLFNLIPVDTALSIGISPVIVMTIYMFLNVLYCYWKYVFIGVFIQSDLVKNIKSLIMLFKDRFIRLKFLLIGFLIVKLSAFMTVLFMSSIIGAKTAFEVSSWIHSLGFLFLEYFIAPYLILNRVARRRGGYSLTTILLAYSLPWAIMGLALSAIINMPLMIMFNWLVIYPYFHGWDKVSIALLINTPIGSLIPTIGEIIAVIVIAYYTEAVTYGYV